MQNSHTLVFPFFSGGYTVLELRLLIDSLISGWFFLPQHLLEVSLNCLREVWLAFLMRFFLRFGSSCSIPLCEEILVGSLFSFLFFLRLHFSFVRFDAGAMALMAFMRDFRSFCEIFWRFRWCFKEIRVFHSFILVGGSIFKGSFRLG